MCDCTSESAVRSGSEMRARGCAAEPDVSRTHVSAATRAARNCPRAHAAQTPRPLRTCYHFWHKSSRGLRPRGISAIYPWPSALHTAGHPSGGVSQLALSPVPPPLPVASRSYPARALRGGGAPLAEGRYPQPPPLPDGRENGVAVTFSCRVGAGSMVVTAALPAPQIPRPGQGSPPLRRPLAAHRRRTHPHLTGSVPVAIDPMPSGAAESRRGDAIGTLHVCWGGHLLGTRGRGTPRPHQQRSPSSRRPPSDPLVGVRACEILLLVQKPLRPSSHAQTEESRRGGAQTAADTARWRGAARPRRLYRDGLRRCAHRFRGR